MKAFSIIGTHDSAAIKPWIQTVDGNVVCGSTRPLAQLAKVPAVGLGRIIGSEGSLGGQVELETAKYGCFSSATLERIEGTYRVRSTEGADVSEDELVLVHVQRWDKEGQCFWLRVNEEDPEIQIIAAGQVTAGLAGRAGVMDQALLVCLIGARIPYLASRRVSNTLVEYWNGQYVVSESGIRSEMIGQRRLS